MARPMGENFTERPLENFTLQQQLAATSKGQVMGAPAALLAVQEKS